MKKLPAEGMNGKESTIWHSLISDTFKALFLFSRWEFIELTYTWSVYSLGFIFKLSLCWSGSIHPSRPQEDMRGGMQLIQLDLQLAKKNHTQEMIKELTDIWREMSRK